MTITSVQNPRIIEISQIRRGRAAHDSPVLIDGRREIQRAVDAGWKIQSLYHCPVQMSEDDRKWLAGCRLDDRILVEVSLPVLEKIAYGQRNDGFVAVAERPVRTLSDLRLGSPAMVAVMHALEKPGNLGGILRTADAAGLDAVIASDPRTDIYNSNVIRASTGAVFSMDIVECFAADAAAFLGDRGIRVYAARPDAPQEYTECDFRGPTAFILGAEAAGLGNAWQGADILPIRIPMRGACDSLNVSVTAAILFFEARRQRTQA